MIEVALLLLLSCFEGSFFFLAFTILQEGFRPESGSLGPTHNFVLIVISFHPASSHVLSTLMVEASRLSTGCCYFGLCTLMYGFCTWI